jgi:hypothetical protein
MLFWIRREITNKNFLEADASSGLSIITINLPLCLLCKKCIILTNCGKIISVCPHILYPKK